jgi:uracil phosphoribosyltransferase
VALNEPGIGYYGTPVTSASSTNFEIEVRKIQGQLNIAKGKAMLARTGPSNLEDSMKAPVHVVSHPLVQHKLTRLRQSETTPSEFRVLMRDVGMLLLYEATRDLPMRDVQIRTPLGEFAAPALENLNICLAPVIRAGLGMVESMIDLMPFAKVAHVGLYRDPKTLEAIEYYFKAPADFSACTVFIVDPMLATGHSAVAAIERIKERTATGIRLISLLAAPEGVALVQAEHPDVPIYTASVDTKLDAHAYIVPGLGDAGDRLYGTG